MTAFVQSEPDYGINQDLAAQYPVPVRAVRHIVDFLQWRFSLLPVGAYHWAPEDQASENGTKSSEIYISADTPLPSRAAGERPAITVSRSQLGFQGSGIGDVQSHNWRTGGKTYSDFVPTTIVINVLSQLAFVSERLAWFVHDQIFTLREEIVRTDKCFVYIGSRATIAPPSAAGSLVDTTKEDWIVVPIYLPTYLQHRTSFIPVNVPVLKKVEVVQREVAKNTKER